MVSSPTATGSCIPARYFTGGYRYSLNNWLAVEGDYDYFRNTQRYSSSANTTLLKTNVNGVTGDAVLKIPTSFILKPYALVGGGVLVFDPRDSNQLDSQTRGTFVYGGGADLSLTKHITARGQYRGFVYKNPDFKLSSIKNDTFTHSAAPSAGLVFTF
jgi:opacity protein-like surface antigen